MANIALLIAGGSGNRMHQDIPKQFLTVNECPVIVYTLEAFERHPEIDAIAVVCIEGWELVLWAYAKQFNITKLKYVVPGGENGQASIRNGVYELEKYFGKDDIVLIHDAIRPMVSAEIISDCIRVVTRYGNAITVIPCAEAMMQTKDGVVSVSNCCAVAGLGGNPYRSGDYDYYIHERIRDNDPKAMGPFINLCLERERLQKK